MDPRNLFVCDNPIEPDNDADLSEDHAAWDEAQGRIEATYNYILGIPDWMISMLL